MRIDLGTPADDAQVVPLFELRAAAVERDAQVAAAAEKKKAEQASAEKPSTLDVFQSAFREASGLGQLVYNQWVIQGDSNEIDRDFNPLTQARQDGLSSHTDYLAVSRNRSEYDARVRRIQQHEKDRCPGRWSAVRAGRSARHSARYKRRQRGNGDCWGDDILYRWRLDGSSSTSAQEPHGRRHRAGNQWSRWPTQQRVYAATLTTGSRVNAAG